MSEGVLTTIGQFIGAYGFPIVMCGLLFWYMVTEQKETRKVIEGNTKILVRLLEHFHIDEGDAKDGKD